MCSVSAAVQGHGEPLDVPISDHLPIILSSCSLALVTCWTLHGAFFLPSQTSLQKTEQTESQAQHGNLTFVTRTRQIPWRWPCWMTSSVGSSGQLKAVRTYFFPSSDVLKWRPQMRFLGGPNCGLYRLNADSFPPSSQLGQLGQPNERTNT